MAFVKKEDGAFVVRQGTPPFTPLNSFTSQADADDEVARLHRENKPASSARGGTASRTFTGAKKTGDVAVSSKKPEKPETSKLAQRLRGGGSVSSRMARALKR